jgi:AbiTii
MTRPGDRVLRFGFRDDCDNGLMRLRERSLIDEIERDALDSGVPIANTLRKVIALGGKVGSMELREWAGLELRGYAGSDVELPEYRKPGAVIQLDGVNMRYQIKGQQISPHSLPEGIREHIDEECPLIHGIGEIEALLERAKAHGGSVKMTLPDAQIIARLVEHEAGEPYQQIHAMYWLVGQSAIEGVIDQVRTTLVELVAEMRAGMPETADTPSAAVADNAVHLAVYGKKSRVNVTSAYASGDGSHHVHASPVREEGRSRWASIGAAIVGLATIVGVLIALAQWQGWVL